MRARADAERRAVPAAFVMALVFSLGAGIASPLTFPDEIRVAEIAREMAVSGDLVVPRLGGEPFLEKPPLYFAAVAGSFAVLGVSDLVARLPSALASFVSLVLVFLVGRRLAGDRAGIAGVCVLATTVVFLRFGHRCMVDSWLLGSTALGTWAFLRSLEEVDARERAARSWPILVFWLAVALGYMTKGPVIAAVLVVPLLAALLIVRGRSALRWGTAFRGAHVAGLGLVAVLAIAWPLALFAHGGDDLVSGHVVQNVLYRLWPTAEYVGSHEHPFGYYFPRLPGVLLPWLVALPFAYVWLARRPELRRSVLAIVAVVLPLGILLLSIPGTKRPVYLMPFTFSASVFVGCWLAAKLSSAWTRRLAWAFAGLYLVGGVVAARLDEGKRDMTPLATELARMGVLDGSLVGYRLDESVRAIVPLRTGFIVTDLRDADELARRSAAEPDLRVLASPAAVAGLPPELGSKLRSVASFSFDHREYRLYAAGTAPPEVAGGAEEDP